MEERPKPQIRRLLARRSMPRASMLSGRRRSLFRAPTAAGAGGGVAPRAGKPAPLPADAPAAAEWMGVRLSIGTWLPLYPAATVRDRQDADLPDANRRAFRLDNAAWEYPTF